jgi:hypothetical protein
MNELQGYAAQIRQVEEQFREEWGTDADEKFDELLEVSKSGDRLRLVHACLNASKSEETYAHSEVHSAYENQTRHYERRNRVRELIVSLITKGGALVSDTQWELVDQLALDEYVDPPADLFLWESNDGQTITILTLMETQDPTSVYERLSDLLPEIDRSMSEISAELGQHRGDDTPLSINQDGIEGAILIARPTTNSNNHHREEIPQTLAPVQEDEPISLWDFDATPEEELTILSDVSVGSIDGWDWHIPNNSLGELLKGSQQFSQRRQASVTHFPDSHHEQMFRKLPTYLHRRNQLRSRDPNEDPINERTRQKWVFSRAEFVDYFVPDESTMTQADVEHRIDPLLSWWQELGVLTEKTSGYEPYYDDGEAGEGDDENSDDTGDEIFTFEDLNTGRKEPDGFWDEAIEPYRNAVATKILEAHLKFKTLPEETREQMDMPSVIESPLEGADQEKIEDALANLTTTVS